MLDQKGDDLVISRSLPVPSLVQLPDYELADWIIAECGFQPCGKHGFYFAGGSHKLNPVAVRVPPMSWVILHDLMRNRISEDVVEHGFPAWAVQGGEREQGFLSG